MSFLTWLFLVLGATWLLTPEDVVRELQHETPAAFHALEQTAMAVARADRLTAPIRWGLGHPPIRDRAAVALGRGFTEANAALAQAAALGPTASVETRVPGLEAAVGAAATALTRSIAASFPSSAPDAAHASSRAARNDADAWRPIYGALNTLKETRARIIRLALWQCFYLVAEVGLTLGFVTVIPWGPPGSAIRVRGVAPIPLTRTDRWVSLAAGAIEARLHPDLGSVGRFLKRQDLPQTLAFEIDRYFRRHRRWPGSLKGHDAVPGGLCRHSLAVGQLMAQKAKAESDDARRAATFLGVIHDLGKTLTYQPSGAGWTSHPASPHDSLSARLLGQLLAFRRAFPEPVRHALLQALRDYHSPEAFATNAPPLAKQFLQWLQEADTEAIEHANDMARETRPA